MPPKLPRDKLKDLPEEVRAYIGALEEYMEYIESRLNRNSRNSSIPPSQDPNPGKRRKKKASGRHAGGQEGHPGVSRPLERPDHTEIRRPHLCDHCGTAFLSDSELVGTPMILQQKELVAKPTAVQQWEYWQCKCGNCGRLVRAQPRPGEEQCLGPRLQATAIFLNAECHVSLAKTEGFFREVLGAPISRATLCGIRPAVSEALQYSTQMVLQEVRAAPVKGMDETGWKHGGSREFLWAVVSEGAAFFAILPSRGRNAAKGILGDEPNGLIMTDGFIVYDFIPEDQHGRCCSHLERDFQALAETSKPTQAEFGKRGLEILTALFLVLKRFRDGGMSEWALWQALQPVRQRLGKLLWRGRMGDDAELQRLSLRLQAQWDSWFLFPERGLDATNNRVERALRPGVIWRKITMGTRTDGGAVYVSRILTALETAKLRNVRPMPFLTKLLACHQKGVTSPPLSVLSVVPEVLGRG